LKYHKKACEDIQPIFPKVDATRANHVDQNSQEINSMIDQCLTYLHEKIVKKYVAIMVEVFRVLLDKALS